MSPNRSSAARERPAVDPTHAHPPTLGISRETPEPPASSRLAALVHEELALLGEDPDREGLRRTPVRVATALAWLTRGYSMSAAEEIGSAVFEEAHQNMVLVRDIGFYSLCEHHMLPF